MRCVCVFANLPMPEKIFAHRSNDDQWLGAYDDQEIASGFAQILSHTLNENNRQPDRRFMCGTHDRSTKAERPASHIL